MDEIDKLLDDLRSVTINNVKTPTQQLHINEQQQQKVKKEKMPQSPPYLLNEYETNNYEQDKLKTNSNNSKNKQYINELDNLLSDLSYAKQKNNSISSAESISNDSSTNSNNYLKYTNNNNNNNINNNNNNNNNKNHHDHQNNTNTNYSNSSSGHLSSNLSPLRYNNNNNNNNNSNNNTNSKQYSSRRSLEKLIDTIDNDELIINRKNNTIQPEVSLEATKELENLMNSLSSYKVTHNDTSNGTSNDNVNLNNNINHDGNLVNIPKKKDATQTPLAYNTCQGCGEQINGQVITALGALWHPSHFICHHCDTVIGTSIFYEKDGKPYCENDYFQLFSPKCATCHQPILDKMLTALNKQFHPQCFKCSSCSKLLNDESFLEKNNAAFCKDCYVCKLAPKCLHCSNPIIDNFISAMNAYWHPNCFVCTECGIAFNSSSFYEYNGLPYCEIHYHYKRGSLCSSCQQPINGRCITAMNKKFHPQHFVCSFCTKQLNKGTFKEQNDKPYCHPCFFKLFPQ